METIEELTEIYLISRNSKTFERGFINRLTGKFEAVKVSFPKCLKCFGCYFREVEIVRKNFHFQKGFNFLQLAKIFVNVFQISEVEYVTVMPIVFKWNI